MPRPGEREVAPIGGAHDDVAFVGRTLGGLVEEPVHVHAERVGDLLQHADRQSRHVALDLAEVADGDAHRRRHVVQRAALRLAQLADATADGASAS